MTDVRIAGSRDRLYVFVSEGRTDEDLTAIRLLTRRHWPDRDFEIVYRSPLRETGETLLEGAASASSDEGRR